MISTVTALSASAYSQPPSPSRWPPLTRLPAMVTAQARLSAADTRLTPSIQRCRATPRQRALATSGVSSRASSTIVLPPQPPQLGSVDRQPLPLDQGHEQPEDDD